MSGDRRPPEYPVLDTEWIYRGAVVSLRRDTLQMENDHTAKREIVDHPGAVGGVVAIDDGQVVLVNQSRPPAGTPPGRVAGRAA